MIWHINFNIKRPHAMITQLKQLPFAQNFDLSNLPSLSHPMVDESRDNLLRAIYYLEEMHQKEVMHACSFGDIAHIKDRRKSGEPYITHPIAVAEILADFHLDKDTVISAILHDTVEDTEVSLELLSQTYNATVASLVDGVTKLKSSEMTKQESQAATFHKILSATINDPRVLTIKLADRLHNMGTLNAVPVDKQKRTANETLQFYVPLARIMGLNDMADYIELLSYRNFNPDMYNKFHDKLLQHGLGRRLQKANIQAHLQNCLIHLSLQGRIHALDNRASMYRQFFKNRGDMSRILHQYQFEIVLDDVDACYKLLDYLMNKHAIDPQNIQNNIKNPLAGGNQSLVIIYEENYNYIKITLLTKRMQKAARLGVLGHENNEISQSVIQASLRNMQALLNKNLEDGVQTNSAKVIDELLGYLNSRKILCYSPQGRAYELPRGSTALDFAYAVGPVIGNIATGAHINEQVGKLGQVLASGDIVNIDTDKSAFPKAEWLGFVATNKARVEILKALRQLPDEQKITQGKLALDRALKTYDKSLADISPEDWADILAWRGVDHQDELFLQIMNGVILPQLVVSRLFSDVIDDSEKDAITQSKHLLAGVKGIEVDFAGCCNPIYGDRIIGHLSKHGLIVHRYKCFSLNDIRRESPYQIINLNWKPTDNDNHDDKFLRFPAKLCIFAMLTEEQISQVIYDMKALNIGIESTKTKHGKDSRNAGTTILHLVVRSRSHLEQGIEKLRNRLGYPNIMRLYA